MKQGSNDTQSSDGISSGIVIESSSIAFVVEVAVCGELNVVLTVFCFMRLEASRGFLTAAFLLSNF